jgi:hypothetical protein
LVSHFSEFPAIFYTIYKIQQFGFTFGVTFLQFGPWKELNACNSTLMAAGRRGLANSGEAGGALGLHPMGRATRPSPCTRRVWVPWTVPRAARTPATPRLPRAAIG